jgi:hypothetical protein
LGVDKRARSLRAEHAQKLRNVCRLGKPNHPDSHYSSRVFAKKDFEKAAGWVIAFPPLISEYCHGQLVEPSLAPLDAARAAPGSA